MSLIKSSHDDTIGTITLNHPETRNSLSNALLEELINALQELAKREVRVVILERSAGRRSGLLV